MLKGRPDEARPREGAPLGGAGWRTRRRLARVAATGVAAAALALPALADAATRYAEPNGNGNPSVCSQAAPCGILEAVEAPSVQAGDEVVVLAGIYALGPETVDVRDAIDVHGQSGGQGRPLLDANGVALHVAHPGATVRVKNAKGDRVKPSCERVRR